MKHEFLKWFDQSNCFRPLFFSFTVFDTQMVRVTTLYIMNSDICLSLRVSKRKKKKKKKTNSLKIILPLFYLYERIVVDFFIHVIACKSSWLASMTAKVNVIWYVDNSCCKLPIFRHFKSTTADILVILTTEILSAYINQKPYNHSTILELSVIRTSGKEIAHFWEDRSRAVRSLFYHKKFPQNEVVLRTMIATLVAHTTSAPQHFGTLYRPRMLLPSSCYLISRNYGMC